jgi:hypothetical protein
MRIVNRDHVGDEIIPALNRMPCNRVLPNACLAYRTVRGQLDRARRDAVKMKGESATGLCL